jgi:hypothetical protein
VREILRESGLVRVADESVVRGDAMRRAALRGDVRRLRPGAFVGVEHWEGIGATQRHLLEVRAAVAAARTSVLISHASAAVLLCLPLVGVRLSRVHATVVGSSGGPPDALVARHATDRPVAETVVDGIRVTTAARTVVDLARTSGFLAGVVAGDAALRSGLVTPDQLRDEVRTVGRLRGVRVARDVVAFVDGRSESPGESLSRVRMRELGLALPTLQHVVTDRQGFVGRVDFWWEEAQVIGEFDGRSKYGIAHGASDAADLLWSEKLREDRLRGATRATVVRWTWSDAWAGTPMANRLRTAGVR